MEALKIERLSKNFGGLQVLEDVSLTVEAGEYVAIIGPNGAGKSTLINVISGEIPSSSGRVYLFGAEITTMPIHHRAHMGLVRSFQIARLFYELTVLDNIRLALQGTRASRYQMFRPATTYGDVLAKAQELLKLIGLWEKRNELMKATSYGEQRKMEFALSLALEPKVMLLDEPTAGLTVADIPDFINRIKTLSQGSTLLLAAHDMDVVFGLADRVVVLYFGRIIADGTPKEIQVDPKVREIYLGVDGETGNAGAS